MMVITSLPPIKERSDPDLSDVKIELLVLPVNCFNAMDKQLYGWMRADPHTTFVYLDEFGKRVTVACVTSNPNPPSHPESGGWWFVGKLKTFLRSFTLEPGDRYFNQNAGWIENRIEHRPFRNAKPFERPTPRPNL